MASAIITAGITTACGRSTPVTTSLPAPDRTVTTSPDVSGESLWVISPTNEQHSYASVVSTRLELASSSTQVVRDSLVSRIDFTLSITRDPRAVSFSGSIDRISIEAGARTGPYDETAPLPFPFSGRLQNSTVTLNQPAGQTVGELADCTNSAVSAVSTVQRALVLAPLQLRRDMRWTDSSSTAMFSGPLPVTLTTTRSYRVIGEGVVSGARAILLERHEKTLASGQGSQGQHRVLIRGEGQGTGRVAIDAVTGALIEAGGTQTSLVTLTASGRDQRFTQVVNERVTKTR